MAKSSVINIKIPIGRIMYFSGRFDLVCRVERWMNEHNKNDGDDDRGRKKYRNESNNEYSR